MKKICPICSTENEAEYKFCKNCGNSLVGGEDTNEQTKEREVENEKFQDSTQPNNQPQGFVVGDYRGVSAEEMAAFVGKKAGVILPKFTKMEITGSKISWCWPAAILGLVLGPMGSAIWFFYRKMYKPAVLFAVIGAIVTVITSILTFGSSNEMLDIAFDAILSGDANAVISAFENLEPTETAFTVIAGFISDAIDIASFIVAGMYGYYIYKNHCISKITSYRSYQADQRYYKIGLASIGGVSGGMLAVGILLIVAIENISSFVMALVSFIV